MVEKLTITPDITDLEYQAELKRIALISERLSSFITETVNNYPSDKTRKLYLVQSLITEIIEKNETPDFTAKQKLEEIYRLTDEFSSTESGKKVEVENTFNLDEVLNPSKDLDLLELCKELGVTD